jgi:hypothetical protein
MLALLIEASCSTSWQDVIEFAIAGLVLIAFLYFRD